MDFENPNEQLFCAVSFMDRPGAGKKFSLLIKEAIEAGAEIDGFHAESGATPLTDAIGGGMGSPSAVKLLLELGADPNKRDQQGWTPWGMCLFRADDRSVNKEMASIRSILEVYDIDRSDENLLELKWAILNKDIEKVKQHIKRGTEFSSPIVYAMESIVSTGCPEMARVLLDAGLSVNDVRPDWPALVQAAEKGNKVLCELLLEYGADLHLYAWDDEQCTPEFMARENGHDELADWLEQYEAGSGERNSKTPKVEANKALLELYEKQTHGINFGLTTEGIVEKLQEWDKHYSITLSQVKTNGFTLDFSRLPRDLESFSQEVYEFCPDMIDQGYACMDDYLKTGREGGLKASKPELMELLKDIDFTKEDFGWEILKKDLTLHQRLVFWWD